MRAPVRAAVAGTALVLCLGACAGAPTAPVPSDATADADDLLIVDCLLPGQVRRLGTRLTYLSPRRPIKTTASICEIRGGEYVAHDRADFATALRIWLPKAEEGDPEAQTYVGEIYEKGLGARADYTTAAAWYRQAADQGHARASINLGYLFEAGLGVERDLTEAMNRYREASGLVDGDLEYVSSVEYANREAAREESVRLQAQVDDLERALADAEARYAERQSRYARGRAELEALRAAVEEERRRMRAAGDPAATADAAPEPGPTAGVPADPTRPIDADAAAENGRLRAELDGASVAVDEREAEIARLNAELGRARDDDAASRERKAELESRLAAAGDRLAQARAEQTRLGGRLRDAELDAARRERGDAMIITGLEAALAERERELERRTSRVDSLERDLARSETLLAGAPAPAERDRLEREVAGQRAALDDARAEQRRLTERLATEQIAARRDRRASDSRLAALERRLAERETELATQREALVLLEEEVAGSRVQLNARDADKVAAVVTRGPAIDIIDPPMLVTRGTPMLSGTDRPALELIGRVAPPETLFAFKVNGATQPVSTAGVFRYFVAPDARALELLAVDEDGISTRLALDLGDRGVEADGAGDTDGATTGAAASAAGGTTATPESVADEALRNIDFGRYHALIVGNDDYATMSDLNTAGRDARTVERLLRERYGFETELLLNATRHDILSALSRLRETLTPADNLLVYYAGHGELDEISRRGYWLPVDAAPDDTRNWIPNAAITDQIDAMTAKHVMVIADSCYSGTLTRSSVARQPPDMSPALRARWYAAMAASKVRTVLSSGGVRPVLDGAPGAEHSVFAQALIDELEANRGVLEAYSLFVDVQRTVAATARDLQVEQNPQYSPIRHSGHEAGEFVFVATDGTG